ncbi:MAG: hypothetical protein H0U76_02005 [Ktedonobacteraceae bacterium]|nr:hypothetical protein [Ktedonobacteraceae bacterium]
MNKTLYGVASMIGLMLLTYHLYVIADDVRVVVQDPNQANKPQEVFKLAVDVTRYFG